MSDPPDGGVDRGRWWRMAMWVGLAALLTGAAIWYSLGSGRLSAPVNWDDVLYMCYAAQRVNDLHAGGILACAEGWLRNTPHSPVSCLMAFGAFLLFGIRDWAPYVACSLIVLAFLLLADWVTGRQRVRVKALIGLYLCTIPMLTYAVTDYKPDIMWGGATCAVAAVCVFRPVVGASARHLLTLGVLCALALLTKPTTTPGTVALLGLCGVLGTVKDWVLGLRRPGFVATVRSWTYVLGTAALLTGPFYYLNWEYFSYYIRETLFGEYKATWYIAGGWPAQFKFYLTGPGGATNLGGHLYLILVVWVAGWGVAVARRDRETLIRAACLLAMTVACYLMPTLNPAKNTLLASPFFALVIVTTAYWVGYVARAEVARFGGNGWTTFALVVMVVAGSLLYRWPSVYYGLGGATRADAGRLHREVYETLLGRVKPYPQLTTVTGTGPVRGITLSWYATRDREPLTFERPYSAKASDYKSYIDRSDFVLAQEDHVAGSLSVMPNEQGHVQGEVLEMMRHRDDFRQLAEFTAADGKKLVLFQRTRWASGVMSGVRAIEGFGPEQGPYPEEKPPLPRFCWGMGHESRLVLTPEWHGQAATLRVECRLTDRAQSVRVMRGGVLLGKHWFQRPWVSETFEVAVPHAEEGQELVLEYTGRGPRRPWSSSENSALYTKVELVPAAGEK